MIGFYLLALAVVFGLLWMPYAEWRYAVRIPAKAAFFFLASGVANLVAT